MSPRNTPEAMGAHRIVAVLGAAEWQLTEKDSDVWFGLLGPLRIGPGRVAVHGVRERAVLAMLLLEPGATVPTGRLAEAVWETSLPRNARNQVQGCVSRLRKQLALAGLGDELLVTDPVGYRIDVDPCGVDLYRFRQLRDRARLAAAAGEYVTAGGVYRAALGLWRGSVLADVDSVLVRRVAAVAEEERAQALEERVRVDLATGAAGELVAELAALVEQYPYRESLHGALMLALFRAGRQVEARAAYRRVRALLHEELGAEPGENLKQLHEAILCQDPGLGTARAAPWWAAGLGNHPVVPPVLGGCAACPGASSGRTRWRAGQRLGRGPPERAPRRAEQVPGVPEVICRRRSL